MPAGTLSHNPQIPAHPGEMVQAPLLALAHTAIAMQPANRPLAEPRVETAPGQYSTASGVLASTGVALCRPHGLRSLLSFSEACHCDGIVSPSCLHTPGSMLPEAGASFFFRGLPL